MHEKCLKSNIFVNETYFCDSTEQAIDVDFTLPDYCPDISKIFKCHAVPRIASKSINGMNVTIDGNVSITILYADKDNRLCSYEYLYPFSKNIELTKDATGGNVYTRIRCDYINCRAVTGRKVDIHGAAGIFIKVFKRKCNEIIADIDDSTIEVLRMSTPATIPMGYAEKYLIIEEDIRLSDGQPAIESILKSNTSVSVKETKIINDKAVVKGELTLGVLYTPDGGGIPQVARTILPFSQIVDIEGVNESCESDTKAEIAFLDIKPKATSGGEVKFLSINAKILLSCEAYCGNDVPIISDAFSRKYEADIKKQKLTFDKITCNINETYICKKNIELDFSINSVLDLWCSLQNNHTKFEDGNMLVNGTLTASMIVSDDNNGLFYIEKPIEFKYRHPFEAKLGAPHCEPEIEVLSCGFTITSSNNIEIRAELGINASIYEKNDVSVVSDLCIDETKCIKRKTDGAMVIYYPAADDRLWDIANKFGASLNEIMNLNNLESQMLEEGKMLLIPIN